jgi:hypothetical protein
MEQIDKVTAKFILKEAKLLGHSDSEKDTYWTIYQRNNKSYILLNNNREDPYMYEIQTNEVENYLDIIE